MAFTPITVTGVYHNPDGSNASGTVEFRLGQRLANATATKQIMLPCTIKATISGGTISQVLNATDDATTTPTGVTYTVCEKILGAPDNEYALPVPAASPGATLALPS